MAAILFAVESAVSRSLPLSAQNLVNMFFERQPPSAKAQTPLFCAPGLDAFASVGTGPIRGSWNYSGLAYAVSGTELYSVDATGSGTLLGTGIGGSGPVSMSDNGQQLIVVNGQSGWIYTLSSNSFQPILSPNFYPSSTVIFMDGYFVLPRDGTNEWYLSALYDGTSYTGTDFASAEAQPGFVTACVQNLQLLFILCTGHIEMWYDAGTEDFPFQRYAGGVINFGCVAPYSIVKQDGAIFFLGSDKVFYRLQANVPIRISTHPIETLLNADPDLTQVAGTTYTWEGHKMMCWTLGASKKTLVFDISTGRWHTRESWDTTTKAGVVNNLGIWRGANALEIYEKILIGDAFTGQIGAVNYANHTEYGNTMSCRSRSAPQHQDRKRVFVPRFELDMQAGVGLTSGQGADPQVMLRWSRDGGYTWSLPQPWRSLGKIGDYLRRLRWLKMGVGYQWVWEVEITDPVYRVLIAAHADLEVGM